MEELSTNREKTVTSTIKYKPPYGHKPLVHKPSKYHYHLRVDKIYGDKTLKLCGQCALRSNLAKDLRYLDQNMLKSRSFGDEMDNVSMTSTATAKKERGLNHKLSKVVTKDEFIDLRCKSLQSLDNQNKFNIDFDVIDLTTERQSGPNLPILTLPSELFKFTQLKRLHLDCNQIKVVPEQLGDNLVNLETLTLSNNRLKDLPNNLDRLTRLTSLHLSSNQFENFPQILYRIQSLRFLDLCTNEIKSIDAEIGSLVYLESLLLFHNSIRELPPKIGQLIHLRTLWLGENRLTKLPREIVQLTNLDWNDYLSSNIDRNPLKEPPIEICSKGLDAIIEYFNT